MSVCFNCEKYLGGEIGFKECNDCSGRICKEKACAGNGVAFALAVLFVWAIWRFY